MFDQYTSSNIIGLFFSASYCRWCKDFMPIMQDLYPELKCVGIDILFVGSDKTKAEFDSYTADHKWPIIPYNDDRESLRDIYSVKTIPALIFVNADGEVIDYDGRKTITSMLNLYEPADLAKQLAMRFSVIEYDSDNSDW